MRCKFAAENKETRFRPKLICLIMPEQDREKFGSICPLQYFCQISERYENTPASCNCVYRKECERE